MGKEPNVLLYDPVTLGLGKSGKAEGFPFRRVHEWPLLCFARMRTSLQLPV